MTLPGIVIDGVVEVSVEERTVVPKAVVVFVTVILEQDGF